MAFVLADIASGKPLRFDILSNDREHLARLFIGSDKERGAVYSVLASLMSQPHLQPGVMEFTFGIVESLQSVGEPQMILDGAQTKSFLTGDARKAVLDCVCTAAVELAEQVRPSAIVFVTAVAYLPDKALTKYGHICKALRTAGYHGSRTDPYHGSNMWMLKRRNSAP